MKFYAIHSHIFALLGLSNHMKGAKNTQNVKHNKSCRIPDKAEIIDSLQLVYIVYLVQTQCVGGQYPAAQFWAHQVSMPGTA